MRRVVVVTAMSSHVAYAGYQSLWAQVYTTYNRVGGGRIYFADLESEYVSPIDIAFLHTVGGEFVWLWLTKLLQMTGRRDAVRVGFGIVQILWSGRLILSADYMGFTFLFYICWFVGSSLPSIRL